MFADFKSVPNDQKKAYGQAINTLKSTAQEKVNSLKTSLESNNSNASSLGDLTRPGEPTNIGGRHPISLVKNQIIDIFSRIGFNVSEGPEIEDDWHNFTGFKFTRTSSCKRYARHFFCTNKS